MNDFYTLQNKKIFLWGNTIFSSKIYDNLLNDCIEVTGMLERKNTTIHGLQNYCLDDIVNGDFVQDDVVFIICLQSSLNQEKLAETIFANGFHNIIFAPLTLKNAEACHHMRTNYEHLLYGDVRNLVFPTYDVFQRESHGYKIVKYFRGNVEVDVAIKYIRTFYRTTVVDEMLQFRDKPISDFDYLHELYDYFYNNGPYPHNYMDIYMHGEKNENFLADRKQLFEAFKHGYELFGMDFFESIPIPVEVKENGLNITDGMHRASFLCKYGISMFPVIMSIDDFIKFLNNSFEV